MVLVYYLYWLREVSKELEETLDREVGGGRSLFVTRRRTVISRIKGLNIRLP